MISTFSLYLFYFFLSQTIFIIRKWALCLTDMARSNIQDVYIMLVMNISITRHMPYFLLRVH